MELSNNKRHCVSWKVLSKVWDQAIWRHQNELSFVTIVSRYLPHWAPGKKEAFSYFLICLSLPASNGGALPSESLLRKLYLQPRTVSPNEANLLIIKIYFFLRYSTSGIASTLEANKFKLLMRVPLDDLEVTKSKQIITLMSQLCLFA